MPTFSLNYGTRVILSLSWMNILKCFTKNPVIIRLFYHFQLSFFSVWSRIDPWIFTLTPSTPSMLTITKKGKPSSSSTPYPNKATSNSNHIPVIDSDLSSSESDEDWCSPSLPYSINHDNLYHLCAYFVFQYLKKWYKNKLQNVVSDWKFRCSINELRT